MAHKCHNCNYLLSLSWDLFVNGRQGIAIILSKIVMKVKGKNNLATVVNDNSN